MPNIGEFHWVGNEEEFIDKIHIRSVQQISIGLFGGNSHSGQYKNEDGCLVWTNEKEDWDFAVILDAHNSAESAELVIKQINNWQAEILTILSLSYEEALTKIQGTILNMFQEETFLSACRNIKGETACLIVLRMHKYVWWFSIGDNILYLYHPELAALGQYQLNQRHFYEWVGQVNTFEQAVPCYSSGVRELRKGTNRLLLTTDGLVECPNEPFSNPKDIYIAMKERSIHDGITSLLETIKNNNVRDSTTIISWDVLVKEEVTRPSDEVKKSVLTKGT